mgnify:CR=1 FL=1
MFYWQDISKKQLEAIDNSTSRINILQGAVRSGKTIASIIRWLEYLENGPEGKLLMVGKTHRTLKRNILDIIHDIVGENNFNYNRGLGEVQIFDKSIYVAGANDARAEDKIRGMTLAGAYCDEVVLYPESFFNMLLSRLSIKDAKLFCTTNPESPYHWLKTNYIDRKDELDLKSFHFTLEDNLTLDPNYVEQLKKEYSGIWYSRYIDGLWVRAEGLVYSNFSEEENVVDELPKMQKYWVGVDYGTMNPTAFGLIGLGIDNNLYLIDEYYHSGRDKVSKTDVQYADELKEFIQRNGVSPEWIFIDPSAASFITQLYQMKSSFAPFRKVAKANNKVLPGIRRVSSLIGENKFLVNRKNINSIKEFQSYSYDKKAQLKGEDKPLKENDHIMDLIRYVISGIRTTYSRVIKYTG